jgi:hypothetical protein
MTAAESRSAIAGIDYEHLAKILGMLGSVHDGEVVNAARQAEKIRTAAGLMWRDILKPETTELVAQKPKRAASAKKTKTQSDPTKKAKQPKPKRQSNPDHFDLENAAGIREAVDFVLASGTANEWERGFLISIRQWPPPLSEKQEATLARLVEKGRQAQASAA